MNIEEYRSYCLSLGADVEERMPFGAFKAARGVLVFYVAGHMFSYFDMDKFTVVNLKCQPERIAELRERCAAVGKPYNGSERHWIGVNPSLADVRLLRLLTLNSFLIVRAKYKRRR